MIVSNILQIERVCDSTWPWREQRHGEGVLVDRENT